MQNLISLEVQIVSKDMPEGCQLHFPDPNKLHEMNLYVIPPSGYWKDGRFVFEIAVPLEYNILVSVRKSRQLHIDSYRYF